jgi:hypothetical protein
MVTRCRARPCRPPNGGKCTAVHSQLVALRPHGRTVAQPCRISLPPRSWFTGDGGRLAGGWLRRPFSSPEGNSIDSQEERCGPGTLFAPQVCAGGSPVGRSHRVHGPARSNPSSPTARARDKEAIADADQGQSKGCVLQSVASLRQSICDLQRGRSKLLTREFRPCHRPARDPLGRDSGS